MVVIPSLMTVLAISLSRPPSQIFVATNGSTIAKLFRIVGSMGTAVSKSSSCTSRGRSGQSLRAACPNKRSNSALQRIVRCQDSIRLRWQDLGIQRVNESNRQLQYRKGFERLEAASVVIRQPHCPKLISLLIVLKI